MEYYRITQARNDLPKEVFNAAHVNASNNMLDNAWINNPIKYNHIMRDS